MIAKQLISDYITPVKSTDTGLDVLGMMDEYRVSHLPVVDNVEFLGLISDSDIYDLNRFEENIGNYLHSLSNPYVTEYQHMFEIIKVISTLKLSLIPVLDGKNQYIGSIEINNLVHAFANFAAIDNPGGIIVLEINVKDYLLTEIAQIIESNDAKILSLYITSHADSTKLEVTLKINKISLQPVIQTFNRYNYIIKASYSEMNAGSDVQDRFDSLMNYLNI
ncbi:MAG: CBS domain-containing protein [Bacteroidales bacterium]|nr:CBS domain-containing protein [Bacteroidales bacterium]